MSRRKLSSLRKEPLLSLRDEDVPDGYMSMYEFFVLSEDSRKMYGEELAKKLRTKSFNNVRNLYYEYGSQDFSLFWNYHLDEITGLELNEFAKFEPLKPFCYQVECFQKLVTYNKKERQRISFGIKLDYFQKYVDEKNRCADLGIEFIPPKPKKNVGRPRKAIVDFGVGDFKLDEKINLKVPRDEVYKRFKHWSKLNKITHKEACYQAIDLLLEQNPIKGLGEYEDYKVVTVFDKYVLQDVRANVPKFDSHIWMDSDFAQKSRTILYRYNMDRKTAHQKELSWTDYVVQAIEHLNNSMPLKYSDPKLWEEYLATKDHEAYVKNLTEKDGE